MEWSPARGAEWNIQNRIKAEGCNEESYWESTEDSEHHHGDSPSFLSTMIESLSHAQSLRGLTLDLSNGSIGACRCETHEQTELWLRTVDDWMRYLMKKYDGRLPVDRLLLLRCGLDERERISSGITSGFSALRSSSSSSSRQCLNRI